MTFDYNKLSKKPGLFRSFTGFSQGEFDDIYGMIEERYDEFEKGRLDREDRKKAIGGGRKFKLVLRERERERFLMPANTKCLRAFVFSASKIPQNLRFWGPEHEMFDSFQKFVEFLGARKEYNKKLRSKRVVSEHTIGKMKKYEIMGPKFINRYEKYYTMTSIVGGFMNFRTMNSSGSIPSE